MNEQTNQMTIHIINITGDKTLRYTQYVFTFNLIEVNLYSLLQTEKHYC